MQPGDAILPLLALVALLGGLLLRARCGWRAAETRAAAAERLAAARGRGLALAAAELRGPGLALMAQAAEAGRSGGQGLHAIAQHLLRVADDLAEFAREPGSRALKELPGPLGPVVDAAVAAVSAQIRPGHRQWQVDPALRRLTIRADRRALEGTLAALLRRAARHSRDGDVVALRHVVASETLAIVIEDEGDGLAAADILADSASPAGGTRGLDLGLSLARSLAAAHGGDIKLESAPGIGARAWLTLPRTRLLEAA
ncbi:sensor histidine kinase [Falsiroseomonas sp. CW058]|uniref:sensor histidine kinase n=1 Tax=Falsiroseomonas sp. CW058 TaxID=3388664 RepID=UPI003D324631